MKRTYVPNVLTRHNSDSQGINLHKSRERLLQKEENKTSMQYLDLESATPWHLSQWKKRPSSPTSSFGKEYL
ncbi:hypothetical protein Gasu2_08220 [Galdieria sulphuraria]|nr:hypothetical protein Gasu2_08220 [Galdieria sulphuraria]